MVPAARSTSAGSTPSVRREDLDQDPVEVGRGGEEAGGDGRVGVARRRRAEIEVGSSSSLRMAQTGNHQCRTPLRFPSFRPRPSLPRRPGHAQVDQGRRLAVEDQRVRRERDEPSVRLLMNTGPETPSAMRVVVPLAWTNTSAVLFVSPGTRLLAREMKACTDPSAEVAPAVVSARSRVTPAPRVNWLHGSGSGFDGAGPQAPATRAAAVTRAVLTDRLNLM